MKTDRAKLHSIYRYLINWLYPNVCPRCGKIIDFNDDMCGECLSRITRYAGNSVIPNIDAFTAFCVYDDDVRPMVLEFKNNDCGNTAYAFARCIAGALRSAGLGTDADYIVPIPMSGRSLRRRGYNQIELIVKELRYMINVPYANVLIKVRETNEQKSMKGAARLENVRNAFGISPKAPDIRGKTMLLIDDLCTTGSTLSEAAKVLKANGAGKVYAASFAKTIRNKKGVSSDNSP
ncbi:MAG: ComF family protein [Ruminiclostridium sp.]|nr:ComF family protein [Ruminiclostridium sp.]